MSTALIFLSEKGLQENAAVTSNVAVDIEHNIILDLKSTNDRVIYDNLIYSSYFCTKLNLFQAKCSQFKEDEKLVSTGLPSAQELYSYSSKNGRALRVYETQNGAAHLEFQENHEAVLHRYTFTSVEKASDFATQNKDLFKTENFNWDISYLDYIL